jgi:hypothetical protein
MPIAVLAFATWDAAIVFLVAVAAALAQKQNYCGITDKEIGNS